MERQRALKRVLSKRTPRSCTLFSFPRSARPTALSTVHSLARFLPALIRLTNQGLSQATTFNADCSRGRKGNHNAPTLFPLWGFFSFVGENDDDDRSTVTRERGYKETITGKHYTYRKKCFQNQIEMNQIKRRSTKKRLCGVHPYLLTNN